MNDSITLQVGSHFIHIIFLPRNERVRMVIGHGQDRVDCPASLREWTEKEWWVLMNQLGSMGDLT